MHAYLLESSLSHVAEQEFKSVPSGAALRSRKFLFMLNFNGRQQEGKYATTHLSPEIKCAMSLDK